jgi:hypothetical protein
VPDAIDVEAEVLSQVRERERPTAGRLVEQPGPRIVGERGVPQVEERATRRARSNETR